MAEYAIIVSGAIREFRQFDTPPSLPHKTTLQILPVVTTDPPFDPDTQVRIGPIVTIEQAQVTRVWTVRTKTPQELLDDDALARDSVMNSFDSSYAVERAILGLIVDEFNLHSTRLASILDVAAQATSLADFKTRMATVQAIPQRTLAQLRTAVRNALSQA